MIFSYEKIYNTEWSSHSLAYSIFQKFDDPNTLVFSTTWADDKDLPQIHDWLNESPEHKVIIISLFDQPLLFNIKHERVKHINTKDFCFWMLAVDQFFKKYNSSELIPTNFKNKFLCYQRKPREEREYLYNLIKKAEGICTLNDGDSSVEYNKGFDEIGDDLVTPNDIWSLGNLDVWNSSFLNIVSETVQNDLKKQDLFISEKTFKPIIGMRPFIVMGHPGITNFLKKKGFETFDDDFGYHPSHDYKQMANNISEIIKDLYLIGPLYKKLLPKIEHNKNVFNQIVKNEWSILNNLSIS